MPEEDPALRSLHRIDLTPLADVAFAIASPLRRVRRRIARRKGGALVAAGFVATGALIVGNAMWEQEGKHPAPLWGQSPQTAFAAHNGHGSEAAAKGGMRAVRPVEAEDAGSGMVQAVQEQLLSLGLYGGPIDGVMTPETADAIEIYEREAGLPVSGEPSVGLLAALSAGADTAGPAPVAEAGAMSVRDMQRHLNARGYGPLAEDGQMGPRTQGALDAFAADQGLAGAPADAVQRALASDGV